MGNLFPTHDRDGMYPGVRKGWWLAVKLASGIARYPGDEDVVADCLAAYARLYCRMLIEHFQEESNDPFWELNSAYSSVLGNNATILRNPGLTAREWIATQMWAAIAWDLPYQECGSARGSLNRALSYTDALMAALRLQPDRSAFPSEIETLDENGSAIVQTDYGLLWSQRMTVLVAAEIVRGLPDDTDRDPEDVVQDAIGRVRSIFDLVRREGGLAMPLVTRDVEEEGMSARRWMVETICPWIARFPSEILPISDGVHDVLDYADTLIRELHLDPDARAFASVIYHDRNAYRPKIRTLNPGLTLLEWFSGHILSAILRTITPTVVPDPDAVVQTAVTRATALIRELNLNPDEGVFPTTVMRGDPHDREYETRPGLNWKEWATLRILAGMNRDAGLDWRCTTEQAAEMVKKATWHVDQISEQISRILGD